MGQLSSKCQLHFCRDERRHWLYQCHPCLWRWHSGWEPQVDFSFLLTNFIRPSKDQSTPTTDALHERHKVGIPDGHGWLCILRWGEHSSTWLGSFPIPGRWAEAEGLERQKNWIQSSKGCEPSKWRIRNSNRKSSFEANRWSWGKSQK